METKETVIYEYRIAGYGEYTRCELIELPVKETTKRYEMNTTYFSPFSMKHQWNKRDEGILFNGRYVFFTNRNDKEAKQLLINRLSEEVQRSQKAFNEAKTALDRVVNGTIKEVKLDD